MNILLFGPPGAGKGTQAALLVKNHKMKHISTGDLFRYNTKNNTPLGLEAKKYMDQGQLVPDSVTISMVENVMQSLDGQGFILDGFPRTVAQADALEALMKKLEAKIDKVLFFEVPQDLFMDRLTGRRVCKQCGALYHIVSKPTAKEGVCDSCGGPVVQRDDDKPEAISTRLKVYDESTKPVKDFYRDMGLLVEIDGTGTTEDVYKRLNSVINI